jgi:Holliday junction resolvasome RuvABC endonuclease subunit
MEDPRATTILAIDPGTRHLGVAVLDGNDLIFATVKAVKDQKMSSAEVLKKTETIIARLIASYNPHVLAIEKTFFVQSKRSSLLNAVTEEIKKLAKRKKLKVYIYAPTTVRKFICKDGKATKMKAASIIVNQYYPWLQRYLEKDQRKRWWEEKYWASMFDAIALGLTCSGMDGQRSGQERAA